MWTAHLQEVYSSFDEFQAYDDIYYLVERLGYEGPLSAWKANPVIQGSTDPKDYKKVRD